jgi:hypothetical protein
VLITGAAVTLIALGTVGAWARFSSPSTGSLEGSLTKPRNAPIANTRVALLPLDPEGSTPETTTDQVGRFAFADVEKGRYTVSIAYDVAAVFECDVRYALEIRAEKTLQRRFRVPLIDVRPDGTAKLRKGKTAKCRTLRDPVKALLCDGSQMPIDVFALPPREEMSGRGYRKVGRIGARACGRVSVVGHLPGPSPLTQRPLGWLFVAVPGTPRLRGWVFPVARRLGAEHQAWWDVAEARAARLAKTTPTLRGGLPDLSFSIPREAQHVGDPCFTPGLVASEWLVNVRNTGRGLAPKRFELFIDNGSQTERRLIGEPTWIRGVAPGESAPLDEFYEQPGNRHTYLGLGAYTRLKLDPDNKVKEADEGNNELALGYLPQLTCVGP